MNKKIRVHPDASREAEAAVEWYARRSPQAAWQFAIELRSAIERIGRTPNQFPMLAFGARKLVLSRFPYLVVFYETKTMIEVVAVAHARRRPGYWQERLGDPPAR